MRYNKKTLKDVDVKDKTVVIRVDFNVPLKDGKVADDNRIRAALPTLKHLLEKGARVVLLSHLSEVKSLEDLKGKKSLRPVSEDLQSKLGAKVKVIFSPANRGESVMKAAAALQPNQILFLENTRYADVDPQTGTVVKLESKNDKDLGHFWASLGTVFVNDAFGTAHRAHASNVGIAQHQKNSCVGFLIEQELNMLAKGLDSPKHPFIAIVGGAKVSDKIAVVKTLLKDADKVLIGGGMAYTFFAASGHKIGKSLVEPEQMELASQTLGGARDKLLLPIDNLVADSFADVAATVVDGRDIPDNVMALDIGPKTIALYEQALKGAKTIAWNGPMGVAEFKHFEKGTLEICRAIAKATDHGAFSLIGGGDSAAAAIKLGFEDKFSHISTGGGASLAYMEKASLPGIEAIADK